MLLAEVESAHGEESVEAAEILDLLTSALTKGGRAGDGETRKHAERALAIKERIYGTDHLEVATSLVNLAEVYRKRAEFDKARLVHERALRIRERSLGSRHPDIAASLSRLASVL